MQPCSQHPFLPILFGALPSSNRSSDEGFQWDALCQGVQLGDTIVVGGWPSSIHETKVVHGHLGRGLYSWAEPVTVQAVRVAAQPPRSLDLSWVFAAMNEGIDQSSSAQIMRAIENLNSLLKERQFRALNAIFFLINPRKLTPELMVTFARVTYPVRHCLPNWYGFVRRIKKELDHRALDSERLLSGLF